MQNKRIKNLLVKLNNRLLGVVPSLLIVGSIVSIAHVFSSCNKAKDIHPIEFNTSNSNLTSYDLLICNEGNFGSGLGSISKVSVTDTTLEAENKAFYNRNEEYLGNVVQSCMHIGDELWIVVNNSQKIVRCDENLNKIADIKGFNSPRYLAQTENKVYVSDLYEDSLYVVSKVDYSITKKIHTGSWNEGLLVVGEQLWLTNTDKNTVSVYSTVDERLIKEVKVAQEPFAIELDADNNVKVLCNGGLMVSVDEPTLFTIHPQTFKIVDELEFVALDGLPTQLSINGTDTYILAGSVYKINGQTTEKILSGLNFYGLEVKGNNLFLTDAKDYVRNGYLHRYKLDDLTIHDSVELDVIPGFVY